MKRIAASVIVGIASGLAVFLSAEVVAIAVSGHAIPPSLRFLAIYALCGAAGALLIAFAHALWTRSAGPPPPLWLGAATMALIYAIPIFHRARAVLRYNEVPDSVGVAAAIGTLAAYIAWIGVLRIAAGPRSMWLALVLGMLSAQFAILLNQEVFFSAVAPDALAGDFGVIAATLFAASATRIPRAPRIAVGVVAAAAGIAVLALRGRPASELVPTVRAQPEQPNLIFFLIDTLRADVFDQVVAQTSEGRRLRDALGDAAWFQETVSTAPWTGPSVASILTGLYPVEHGLRVPPRPHENSPVPPMTSLSPSVRTLAEELRDRGYVTDAIMTNPQLFPQTGVARGYMRYELIPCAARSLPLLQAFADWELLDCRYEDARGVRRRLEARLIDLEASGAPIFLWIHLMDPHHPLVPIRGLDPDPEGAGLTGLDRLYRDGVRYAAHEVATMIELLRTRPWWSNAAVIVTGDHGDMLPSDRRTLHVLGFDGTPLAYGHGCSLHDELAHVPLVIRPPGGLPERRTLDVVTSQVDLLVTLSDLLDLGLPRNGRYSLAPWLSREEPVSQPDRRSWAYISSNAIGPQREAVRSDRFKLILYEDGQGRSELFDLATDPKEQTDSAAAHPNARAEALAQLEQMRVGLRPVEKTEAVSLPDEIRDQLEALGYVQ